MRKYYKVIVIVLCVAVLAITFGLLISMNNQINNGQDLQNDSEQQLETNVNDYENDIIVENTENSENVTDNDIEENVVENNVVNEPENSTPPQSTEETSENLSNEDKEKKAIAIAKQEWGEDDSVYYTNEGHSGDVYMVAVRSKATTAAQCYYNVDIIAGTAEMDF